MKARQDLTKTFSIDYVSDQDNIRYTGDFTIKKLAIRDIAALGVRKSQLNGGMYYDEKAPGRGVDESTDEFNNMIAHLELSIQKAPPWWDLDSITDTSLLGYVFTEVLKFEQTFLSRKSKREDAGSDGQGSGASNISKTNSGGSTSQVVEQEVQAALKP